MQFKIMFAQFTYGDWVHPDCSDWLNVTCHTVRNDPRVAEVHMYRKSDTPITMVRNNCLQEAKRLGADFVFMVDTDMAPDYEAHLPGKKKFWPSTIDFMLNHPGPCVVAAPYTGPPPHQNVYVFRWGQKMNDNPNPGWSLDQFGREEASHMAGIGPVAALPTGVVLIDMRALAKIPPPYFYYEWTDEFQQYKASTEDVVFTRNLSLAGIPVYCNWDAWAGHWKSIRCDRPAVIHTDHISDSYKKALDMGLVSTERMMDVNIPQRMPRMQPATNGHLNGINDAKPNGRKRAKVKVASHPPTGRTIQC